MPRSPLATFYLAPSNGRLGCRWVYLAYREAKIGAIFGYATASFEYASTSTVTIGTNSDL